MIISIDTSKIAEEIKIATKKALETAQESMKISSKTKNEEEGTTNNGLNDVQDVTSSGLGKVLTDFAQRVESQLELRETSMEDLADRIETAISHLKTTDTLGGGELYEHGHAWYEHGHEDGVKKERERNKKILISAGLLPLFEEQEKTVAPIWKDNQAAEEDDSKEDERNDY